MALREVTGQRTGELFGSVRDGAEYRETAPTSRVFQRFPSTAQQWFQRRFYANRYVPARLRMVFWRRRQKRAEWQRSAAARKRRDVFFTRSRENRMGANTSGTPARPSRPARTPARRLRVI